MNGRDGAPAPSAPLSGATLRVNDTVGVPVPPALRAVTPRRGVPTHLAIRRIFVLSFVVEIPQRKSLPHEVPSWVDPKKEIYFITINCEKRFTNQLALPDISKKLFETVRYRQEKFLWWPYLFLLMPDHLHALISFPPSGKSLQLVISKWKEWAAKDLGIIWQRNFFEHRLRHDQSRREKADYILQNPVRKHLIARPEDWPFVYFGDGKRPEFDR